MFAFIKKPPYIVFLCINQFANMWDLQFWHMEIIPQDFAGHYILNFYITSPTMSKNHKQNIPLPQT
jgi:hypothetical protein